MALELPPSLAERSAKSEDTRRRFREVFANKAVELLDGRPVCIYATGSYGRQEAWHRADGTSGSDIDLFILDGSLDQKLSRLTTVKVQARLIETAEELGFPDFDGDGRFLDVHAVREMTDEIGSDTEDSKNFFTARLLLLLESRPLFGDNQYGEAIESFVEVYLRDWVTHSASFRPAFIMNDIDRFWRTLCLNYENKRRNTTDDEQVKHRLKDMKLGFSRMLTCQSGKIDLASAYASNGTVKPEDVVNMTRRTPVERLVHVASVHDGLSDNITAALESYAWFLQELGQEKDAAYQVLSTDRRQEARDRQETFHRSLLATFDTLVRETDLERFAYM